MLHLRAGIEVADGADLLCGSSVNGVPGIRQMSQMPDALKGNRRCGPFFNRATKSGLTGLLGNLAGKVSFFL